MAKTIGQLTQATTLASGDEFVIEQSGLTKRVAASVVRGGLVNADIDAAAAIAGSKLADGGIVTAKIADANVTTAKIADANVTTAKIADDAVTNDKLSLAANAGEIKKALNADNSPPIYACRAWVNFDGTDANATTVGGERLCNVRASGNVTKVVRTAGGNYNIHITTALPDANYAVSVTAWNTNSQMFINGGSVHTVTPTSSLFRIRTAVGTEALTGDTTGSDTDAAHVFVAVFR
jgi:hypothetical protein